MTQTQSLQNAQPKEEPITFWVWVAAALGASVVALGLSYVFRDALSTPIRSLQSQIQRFASTTFVTLREAKQSAQETGGTNHAHHEVPPAPRDTVGAISAMELAYAFIEEVRTHGRAATRRQGGAQASAQHARPCGRQLDAPRNSIPMPMLEGEDGNGVALRFTISELKVGGPPLLEGLTHQVYDLQRAIPALVARPTRTQRTPVRSTSSASPTPPT